MKLASVGLAFVCATVLFGNGWQINGMRVDKSEAIAAEPSEVQAETQKLIGRWEIDLAGDDANNRILIFSPDGKLYVVDPKQKTAIASEYQVSNSNGQIYLDVMQGSIGSRVTFAISDRSHLVISQLLIPLGMQYTNGGIVGTLFLPNTLFLKRISNDGTLPTGIEIASNAFQTHAVGQSEAKTYVGSMNRAEQAFFTEKSYFTGKLDELGLGIKPETEKYSYQIMVLDGKKAVQTIGLAKKNGLMSYTGLAYTKTEPSTGEVLYTEALLCVSKKPTKAKPPTFKLSPEPTCPDGYEPVGH